jgi:hypothetical protein
VCVRATRPQVRACVGASERETLSAGPTRAKLSPVLHQGAAWYDFHPMLVLAPAPPKARA